MVVSIEWFQIHYMNILDISPFPSTLKVVVVVWGFPNAPLEISRAGEELERLVQVRGFVGWMSRWLMGDVFTYTLED